MGQQDCKDFFICLTENRQHWQDVFELFKVDSVSSTTCTICNHESKQDQGTTQSTFLMFDVPNDNVPISTFIEDRLNSVEEIDQWRDEDGCKLSTIGMYRLRIKDLKSTKYLLVILSRLIRVDNNLEIVERKTPLGGNICLTDVSGNKGIFMPVAIIHHSGQVMGDVTWGIIKQMC